METSYVQVYTGDGKGKTTAAFGLALRAVGRGLSVRIVQFMKGRDTGEVFAVEKIEGIEILRVSECKKFYKDLTQKEKEEIRAGIERTLPLIIGWLGVADVLILDEAIAALNLGILKQEEILRIIEKKQGTEIVLTGRDAPGWLLDKADLVTEMKEVKHYYKNGERARVGIEF